MTQSKAQTTSSESETSDPVLKRKLERAEMAKSPEAWAAYQKKLGPAVDPLEIMRAAGEDSETP